MTTLQVPILAVVTGEGGSGGALALAVADRVLMFENGIYSVISPEGCAAILWKDAAPRPRAAAALRITAADLLRAGHRRRRDPRAARRGARRPVVAAERARRRRCRGRTRRARRDPARQLVARRSSAAARHRIHRAHRRRAGSGAGMSHRRPAGSSPADRGAGPAIRSPRDHPARRPAAVPAGRTVTRLARDLARATAPDRVQRTAPGSSWSGRKAAAGPARRGCGGPPGRRPPRRLRRRPGEAGPAPDPRPPRVVRAPLVGTFYRAPQPGAPPFVTAGDVVEPGTAVGIVEAMKLMNDVTAESTGRSRSVLPADGSGSSSTSRWSCWISVAGDEDSAGRRTARDVRPRS